MEILPAVVLYAEVILLASIDKNLWRTLYTPFNVLAIPYAVVLTVCLLINGTMGFGAFYYPSIWVWVIGLLVFYVPSFLLGALYNAATRGVSDLSFKFYESDIRTLEKITQVIIVLFLVWIAYLFSTSAFKPGSDEFGVALAGKVCSGICFRY